MRRCCLSNRRLVLVAALATAPLHACSDDSAAVGGGGAGAGGAANGGAGAGTSTGIDLTSTSTGLPPMFHIAGTVVDQDGLPVEGAAVMQGGGDIQMTTGADGAFELDMTQDIAGVPTPVAAKVGYRSAGIELETVPMELVTLELRIIRPPDNFGAYMFGEPGVGDPAVDNNTSFCGHCHTTFTAQFQTSAHAKATRDPLVQDLYAGVASAITSGPACTSQNGVFRAGTKPGMPSAAEQRCYVGAGVLPDLNGCGVGQACDDPALPAAQKPTAFGACADCHGLGMDGPAGGRNLLDAEGVGYENGNHCDACHHVRDIDLAQPPGGGGRLVMQRPRETLTDDIGSPIRQALFGPYPDVPNGFMGGSWQPKFSTAELCAGCHEQKQEALLPGASLATRFSDGLPTHSTFTEWSEGPFAQADVHCQSCHMPPVEGLFNSVDVANPDDAGLAGGFARSPEQLRSHLFRGPLTVTPEGRLIDGAVSITIDAQPTGTDLDVEVTITNTACGHAIPTGEPMRSLVLLVNVTGCSETFAPNGGMTIPDHGGATALVVLGAGASLGGTTLTWPAGAADAQPGARVRVVRPTGLYWDYDGVGLFEGAALPPDEKGLEILEPVGEATVISAGGGTIELSSLLSGQSGDIVYLGDAPPAAFADGDPARALAGAPGMAFARVLVDPAGSRGTPHYRAIDIASDNRIRPQEATTTTHRFAVPPGCTLATVQATVLYRPLPLSLATERQWDARDYIVRAESSDVAIPEVSIRRGPDYGFIERARARASSARASGASGDSGHLARND